MLVPPVPAARSRSARRNRSMTVVGVGVRVRVVVPAGTAAETRVGAAPAAALVRSARGRPVGKCRIDAVYNATIASRIGGVSGGIVQQIASGPLSLFGGGGINRREPRMKPLCHQPLSLLRRQRGGVRRGGEERGGDGALTIEAFNPPPSAVAVVQVRARRSSFVAGPARAHRRGDGGGDAGRRQSPLRLECSSERPAGESACSD